MPTRAASNGQNRTGIATSPQAARRMIEGTHEFAPNGIGDEQDIGLVRQTFVLKSEPLGSIPPPSGFGGVVNAVVETFKGARPTQYIDKLSERITFERTGVRLYEALISKYAVFGGFSGGPKLSELQEMMSEEHEHYRLLSDVLTNIGGDPTAMTPSADLHATMSKGVAEVMVDARTTFVQCLEGLLVLELADNESWEALIELARQNGQAEDVASFERAREEEAAHLESVRAWIAAAQNREQD